MSDQQENNNEQQERISDLPIKENVGSLNSNKAEPNAKGEAPKANPSIVTILSIWNTMIGSSTVTMPNCVANAGLIPTILFNLIFVSICFYTCRIVVKTGRYDIDYANTVKRYFSNKYGKIGGKVGRFLQIFFNLGINLGATFIYFLTINQNFYPCLALLLKACGADVNPEDIVPTFKTFSIIYCGIIVVVLAFPLLIMKDLRIVVKINSFGIYFVSVLLLFVMYIGISSLCTTNFDFAYYKNNATEPRYLYLFGPDPSILMGTLSLGYFSHSFVLPMMKNNKDQNHNTRDLCLGYLCVTATYVVVGSLGYIGFSGKQFGPEFLDNWFRFFKPDDILIIILRLISVFQLLSILPVLYSIVRVQFFDTFFSSGEKDENFNLIPYDASTKEIVVFSSVLSILCLVILYTCYNSLGKMLGYVGASTGLFLIYIIPLLINYIYFNRRHELEYGLLVEKLNNSVDGEEPPTKVEKEGEKDPIVKHVDDFGITDKSRNSVKDILFYIAEILLVLFGLFTFVIQFVKINFFGIVLKDNPN